VTGQREIDWQHPPLARRDGAQASKQAAAEALASGQVAGQEAACLAALRRTPGLTALELARRHGMDRYVTGRRLPSLAAKGHVHKGQERRCSVSGRLAAPWWPV